MKNNWTVYLLRCATNGSLYCGVTTDLQKRIHQHNLGKGAKYTKMFGPVSLVISKSGFNKRDAYRMEACIKKLPRVRKIPFMEALQ